MRTNFTQHLCTFQPKHASPNKKSDLASVLGRILFFVLFVHARLLAQTEFSDNLAITIDVAVLEVVEQRTALADELAKSKCSTFILLV